LMRLVAVVKLAESLQFSLQFLGIS
jgi:hypothetical protein